MTTRKLKKNKLFRKKYSEKQKGGVIGFGLFEASQNGDVDIVKKLLDEGESDVNYVWMRGLTPLLVASQEGHVDVVRELVERGADINKADDVRCSPLCAASKNGHLEVVKLLLEKGASVEGENGDIALMWANWRAKPEIISLLLEKGADVNANDNGHLSALMVASRFGGIYAVEAVKILLDKGADVNAKDRGGFTALIVASDKGNTEVVKLLLDAEADVNATTNEKGYTAFIVASANGHTETMNLLKPHVQIPVMTKEEFETCENDEGVVTCAITLEELNKENTVKPPGDNKVCFKRSSLQRWLKINNTHPITRVPIDTKWINKWYPLGMNENYDDMTGGKRKTSKSKKTKNAKKTRKRLKKVKH